MENVVVAVFPVESEAYQAFSRIKDGTTELSGYLVSQMAIVKKMGNNVQLEDEFDTGMKTSDDTISGGLIGALIGILGGPLGILLGGGIGTLIGSSIDLGDIDTNNSMIEREEEREDVISNVTEHMEGLDPKIVNMLSEFSEQLYPIDKLKSFTDEHSIAYMRVGYEKYMVNIPLSAEWRSLFVKPGARIYVINTDSKKNLEDEIKKGLISRLKRHCTNKGESKDREVQELVEKRKLVQIKSDFYKKIIAESAMQMNMDKLNNAIKFDADDEIEYIPLGDNEYRVILPLKKDYCIQLGLGSSVQLDISFEEDPVEAEDDFREMIENQFYSEYIEGEQDLDPDVEEELEEIIEEMWEMPIRKITFIDWLDSEENLKWLNQCYVALWQVLFLRGEYDEIQRTIADLYYACEKFEELGIPVPFKKFI